MKKKLYSAILASIMVIGSICGVAIPVYAKEETKIIDGNDSYDTATYLDVNGSYSDVLSDSNDVDFYKLIPDSNGKLSINFGHVYGESSHGWKVIIYKYQDGEYIELSDTVIKLEDSEKVELPFVGVQYGCEYYIKVQNYNWDAVNKVYTIKTTFIRSEQYEREENDSYNKATEMKLNSSYTGTLNNDNDIDIYRINATGNGKIELTFEHVYTDDSHGWDIIIYRYTNGEYQELSNDRVTLKDNEKYRLPYIGAVSDGIYYVKIKNYNWRAVGKEYVIRNNFQQSDYYEKEENNNIEEGVDDERLGIEKLFAHYDEVCDRLKIAGIYIDGKLEAFTMGELLNKNMALIHIEKANPEIRGLYPYINQQFLVHEFPDVEFVNREEDMGIEGLRKAKLSYHPCKFVEKYTVREAN